MLERKRLADILSDNSSSSSVQNLWDATEAAEEFGPLPGGVYTARLEKGELFNSRTNSTPGFKLEFCVLEGDYAKRRFWLDLWLTPAAMPQTKRDLSKLGVTKVDQLEQPIPAGIVCTVQLSLRRDDDGAEFNRVRSFEVLRIDGADVDPFASKSEVAPEKSPAADDGESAVTK